MKYALYGFLALLAAAFLVVALLTLGWVRPA
jgi:hypothetical protein